MEARYPSKELTLVELLDGLIDKGAVLSGELFISVAGIDLVYVDLKLLITSVETIERNRKNLIDNSLDCGVIHHDTDRH
ncbi:gas vesicle protein [Brevibacillus dissolubilis]|uniref:gas vesicle protein n=1 Tax=Brevibacillus dissolubilis TaxID=1844116 RepID=UPI0011163C31|nr:gas vesicle protein [Brevibacillus dissolubilis]